MLAMRGNGRHGERDRPGYTGIININIFIHSFIYLFIKSRGDRPGSRREGQRPARREREGRERRDEAEGGWGGL